MSIFQSTEGKAVMVQWHERFRERIGRPVRSRQLDTRFGATHALECGPDDAPPIVFLHGALASSAHVMAEVVDLADRFRVIGLDVIGQSPMSAEVRPEVKGNDYGHWVVDCLDALDLPDTRLAGVSWGGFVACRAAMVAPERISKLSLVVPAGIVNGISMDAVMAMVHMSLYRAFPSQPRLERFLKYILTTPDAEWTGHLGDAFRHFRMDFRPPPLLGLNDLDGFKSPVQLIAAERDHGFPCKKMLARAQMVFPNLVSTEILAGNRHSPATDPESRKRLTGIIAEFMGQAAQVE